MHRPKLLDIVWHGTVKSTVEHCVWQKVPEDAQFVSDDYVKKLLPSSGQLQLVTECYMHDVLRRTVCCQKWPEEHDSEHSYFFSSFIRLVCQHGLAYWSHNWLIIVQQVILTNACSSQLNHSLFSAFDVMAAKWSSYLRPPCAADADIIFLPCGFFFLSFSSLNHSRCRLDVCHT